MTALDVGYAVLAFLFWLGLLVVVAGWQDVRDEKALDERLRRRYRPGRAE